MKTDSWQLPKQDYDDVFPSGEQVDLWASWLISSWKHAVKLIQMNKLTSLVSMLEENKKIFIWLFLYMLLESDGFQQNMLIVQNNDYYPEIHTL